RDIARTSNAVVDGLDTDYTWNFSYVAGDKIYCVHEAEDAETVREHARRGGFPADVVVEIADRFGPATATE
ncbi:MAG TPA: nickel-binding protein, partial [Cellulomonas sp.]|nr:nickel-binding protein [Cellulomonas sp.]